MASVAFGTNRSRWEIVARFNATRPGIREGIAAPIEVTVNIVWLDTDETTTALAFINGVSDNNRMGISDAGGTERARASQSGRLGQRRIGCHGAAGATTSRSAATTAAAALCQRGRTDGDCCKQRKSEYFSYRHAGLHVGVSFMKKPPTRGLFRFGQTQLGPCRIR